MTNNIDCLVYGVKGNADPVLIGSSPMTAKMKAAELARQYFGAFHYDDDSEGDMCFAAMEELIKYMEEIGYKLDMVKFIHPVSTTHGSGETDVTQPVA